MPGQACESAAVAWIVHQTGQQSFTTGATQMADEDKSSLFGDFGKMPSFDFTKLMKDFKLPGVDIATIMDREKKNIEALTEANRVAFEGWQALVHRQGGGSAGIEQAGRRHPAR